VATTESGVGLEEARHPAVDLEGARHAARDQRKIVGGIAAASALPVDEARRLPGHEEDVLSS